MVIKITEGGRPLLMSTDLSHRQKSLPDLPWGKLEGKRRRGRRRRRWLESVANPVDVSLSRLGEIVQDREAGRAAVHGGCRELDVT